MTALDLHWTPDPFERRVVGDKGHILLRVNAGHAEDAVKAIGRRDPPAWSRQLDTFRVAA